MGGGLLQLVAYGAQDVYLTGNPQITFFKVVYRRHTNFAMEAIQQTFNGNFGFNQTVYCQISRNGDLIHRTYLQVKLPSLTSYAYDDLRTPRYVNYIGQRLLKTVTLEIGGQQIDKHYSDWLYIWNELSLPIGKREGYRFMVGADSDVTSGVESASTCADTNEQNGTTLYVPLEFWFCRNIGLALPLIALQYHEVKIKIEVESLANCVYKINSTTPSNTPLTYATAFTTNGYSLYTIGSSPFGTDTNQSTKESTDVTSLNSLSANLWVDYIFLDTDERRRFAQLSHEYLIEQLQFTGSETLAVGNNRIKLNFNHPCKELIWVSKNSAAIDQWYNYTAINGTDTVTNPILGTKYISPSYDLSAPSFEKSTVSHLFGAYSSNIIMDVAPTNGINPFKNGLIQLNGNDRFAQRYGDYFNYVQPYQHHTNIPENKGINVYSFALKPEEHQPSGSLNMSRIDTATLAVETAYTSLTGSPVINIYAINYNVLRILSGMGGLAYSN